jgi:hypothetical protein
MWGWGARGYNFRHEVDPMIVPRLLLLALVVSASVVPAAAQSSAPSSANPFQSQWPQKGAVAPLQFGPKSVTPSSPEPFKLHMSPKSGQAFGSSIGLGQHRWMAVPGNRVLQLVAPEACYAIRSYNFSKQSPGSDATRFAGSSTCQLVSSAKMKDVVTSPVVVAP